MSTIKIRGVDVKFPYEKPYDIQVAYMEKVIECLDDVSVRPVAGYTCYFYKEIFLSFYV